MELRGQEHKRIVMPSTFVYNTSIRELNPKPCHASLFSTLGGRIDGAAIPSSSQVFDKNDHHIYQQQSPPPPPPLELQQEVTPAPPQPLQPQQQQQQQQKQEVAPPSPPKSPIQPNQRKASDPEPEPVSIAVVGSKPNTPTSRNEVTSILYGECRKNHAANVGGHVIDGCGEFMPGGEEGTLEALKCAACQCHRNFHRRDADGEPHSGSNYYHCYNPNSKPNGSRSRILRVPPLPPLSQPIQKIPFGLPTTALSALIPPIMMNFGRGRGDSCAGTDSSSEELNVYHTNVTGTGHLLQPPHYRCSLSNKRFRTKFTKDQKHKMVEFAEKVGWRMPKQDEALVKHFCDEVGVKRQVLKVWMHNNKHTINKKDL